MSKFHVTCRLVNASNRINDVEFADHGEHKRTTKPVSEDVAATFRGIKGYEFEEVSERQPANPAQNGAKKPKGGVKPSDGDNAPAGGAESPGTAGAESPEPGLELDAAPATDAAE